MIFNLLDKECFSENKTKNSANNSKTNMVNFKAKLQNKFDNIKLNIFDSKSKGIQETNKISKAKKIFSTLSAESLLNIAGPNSGLMFDKNMFTFKLKDESAFNVQEMSDNNQKIHRKFIYLF